MNFISQMPFQDQFQIISLLAQPLCFSSSQSIPVILVVFLVIIWRPKKKISLKSCPFSRKFAVLARRYPIKLFQVMQILFIHSEHFRSCFLSRLSGGHLSEHFFVLSFQFRSSQYSYGGSFKILFLVYHINPFVLSILPVVHEDLLKFAICHFSILFQEE